jgi:ferredoxin
MRLVPKKQFIKPGSKEDFMGNLTFSEKRRIPMYDDPAQINNGRIEVNHDKCTGCGFCAKVCPADALFLESKHPQMRPPGVNECMGCGDCMAICPEGAIVLAKSYAYTGYFKTIDRGDLMLPRL